MEKVMIIDLIIRLIEKTLIYKMSYFLKPQANRNKIEVKLDLSIYAQNLTKKMQQVPIHCNMLRKKI